MFDNSYAALPERFYARIHPEQAPQPQLVRLNRPLAKQLGFDVEWLQSPEGVAMLSGTRLPESADPIAMAYAGHQFAGWSPQLGDGRAHLIGEILDPQGVRFDMHLKGSGRTPFSRRGDGKAALGPVLREYLISEWFAGMGIPATRTLAAVLTGESVWREGVLPGAVLVRMAQSHVRVGTLQYFAAQNDSEAVRLLADYLVDRHFPELRAVENRYLALFEAIVRRQARLIAQWMGVGFIHGVMNTDNMQVAGETIDFGPCAFMDAFRFDKVFSSIDQFGRYAWGRQPQIAQWNLARLAEALLPLLAEEQERAVELATGALDDFVALYEREFSARFCAKLGLHADSGVDAFIATTLSAMQAQRVDFTLFFRRLTQLANGADAVALHALFADPKAGADWWAEWRCLHDKAPDKRASLERMQRANPIYIPRNHRIEQAIAAANGGDFAPFHALADLLAQPLVEQTGMAHLELPPQPHEEVAQTFCGT